MVVQHDIRFFLRFRILMRQHAEEVAAQFLAGRADVLLVPTIEAGNILGKAFSWLAGKPVAHVIEGARAPVLIPSRVERADDKLLSIALGAEDIIRG